MERMGDKTSKLPSVMHSNASIYVNFPYCESPCSYCHYKSNIKFGHQCIPDSYLLAVVKQIEEYFRQNHIKDRQFESCYFGGGTPSLLRVQQIKLILSVFEKYGIDFAEKSIEIHPNASIEDILSVHFFNRFSLGAQSFDVKQLDLWRRPLNTECKIRDFISLIREYEAGAIINLDLLFHLEINARDLELAHQLDADTITIYPLTGARTEEEAALTIDTLKRMASLLPTYTRMSELSFHFYRNSADLSLYAQGEYTGKVDVIGFGHNSLSNIQSCRYVSKYEASSDSPIILEKSTNTRKEIFFQSLCYGVDEYLLSLIPAEYRKILLASDGVTMSHLVLNRETWKGAYLYLQSLGDEKTLSLFFSSLFWSDSRIKNLDLLFDFIESLEQKRTVNSSPVSPIADEIFKATQVSEVDVHSLDDSALEKQTIPDKRVLVEGIDGSGKDTLIRLTIEHLKKIYERKNNKSISVSGAPSSTRIYGRECLSFVEDAVLDFSCGEMRRMLSENRTSHHLAMDEQYPGLQFYIRDILTELGTLQRLYPNEEVQTNFSDYDLIIIVYAKPTVARKRILQRPIAVTWRESLENLEYFSDYFLNSVRHQSCPYIVINNSADNEELLGQKARQLANYIFNRFSTSCS